MSRKVVICLVIVATFVFGSPFILGNPNATATINWQVDPNFFRVPLVGSYELTRVGGLNLDGTQIYSTCGSGTYGAHMGTPGSYFMDLNGTNDAEAEILASGTGTIRGADYDALKGNYVTLESHGVFFQYQHLAQIYVSEGQVVSIGDYVGKMGTTGNSHGIHLHWEAWTLSDPNNPQSRVPYAGIYSINGVEEDLSDPCQGLNDGEVTGAPLSGMSGPYPCVGFVDMCYVDNLPVDPNTVSLIYQHCEHNGVCADLLQTSSPVNLPSGLNDAASSVRIPDGQSIKLFENENGGGDWVCLNDDETDFLDNYFVGGTPLGDHVSSYQRFPYPNCNNLPGDTGGGGDPTPTPVPQYGDSRVDIREDPNYANGQYGWDNPTGGGFNVPDYMDNRASSIQLDDGWSIMVAEEPNGGGLKKCTVRSEPNLSNAHYDAGHPVNDTISSVWVYQDTTCGGQYLGLEPGDTVTVWVDPGYSGTRYGWHDPVAQNVLDYVQNQISSIGVQPGWSVAVYEHQDQVGSMLCFTMSDPDLTDNQFDNGTWANDTIESVAIFHDANCGGNLMVNHGVLRPGNIAQVPCGSGVLNMFECPSFECCPELDCQVVATILECGYVLIIDGPIDDRGHGFRWWQVNYNGVVGWTSSGWLDRGGLWIEPVQ
ncbi:hypothetical protein A2415_00220 [candidate division WWE3 bacterium RIFOXYC1_FULL_39_7]|uniref:M23ase beta-sheet core domain-containing protein n=1 Tax=candidate division WWE3 bacterium RIFOXYC1_FULL_39_7 TaxID=1802643 RepID=A0A1F4WIB5_UNCKA|nr:MAG: hypothetical protein A2415_00220 [candidate division WWE3 bacterium RIFOXYC1_FULL_39_7]